MAPCAPPRPLPRRYHARTATLSLGSAAIVRFSRRLRTDEIGRLRRRRDSPDGPDGPRRPPLRNGEGGAGEGDGGGGDKEEDDDEGEDDADDGGAFELVLQPRSLLVFSGAAYSDWLHEIAAVREETVGAATVNCAAAGVRVGDRIWRGLRHSLTLRAARRRHGGGAAAPRGS